MKIKIKRLLSWILALTLSLSMLPLTMFTVTSAAYSANDTVAFGWYPQSKVTDASLIEKLNDLPLPPDSIVTFDGSRYLKEGIYWYKFEQIKWRVLSVTGSEAFLFCDVTLDSIPFNDTPAAVNWESSTLRFWLNHNFYTMAFSSSEKDLIPINPEGGLDDHVFLLTRNQLFDPLLGFAPREDIYDPAKVSVGTDWAISHGLNVSAGNMPWWFNYSYSLTPHDYAWAINNSNVTSYDLINSTVGVRPAIKITSAYKSVVFNKNGGSGVLLTVTQQCGTALYLPPWGYTKENYTFIGWNTDPLATSTLSDFYIQAQDTTLYAIYKINQYTVSFDPNGGIGYLPDVTQDYGTPVTLPTEGFTRTGYTFLGWNTDSHATVPLTSYTVPARDSVLYAVWSLNTYHARFMVDGSPYMDFQVKYGDPVPIPPDPVKTNYTFTGWVPAIPPLMPAEDITFTATFQLNTYNAYFIVDGLLYATVPTLSGEQIIAPPDPQKPGTVFKQWSPPVGVMGSSDQYYTAEFTAYKIDITSGNKILGNKYYCKVPLCMKYKSYSTKLGLKTNIPESLMQTAQIQWSSDSPNVMVTNIGHGQTCKCSPAVNKCCSANITVTIIIDGVQYKQTVFLAFYKFCWERWFCV